MSLDSLTGHCWSCGQFDGWPFDRRHLEAAYRNDPKTKRLHMAEPTHGHSKDHAYVRQAGLGPPEEVKPLCDRQKPRLDGNEAAEPGQRRRVQHPSDSCMPVPHIRY